jgi:hypothetical protein
MGPLLAEEATIQFPELVAPLLVAAVAATVLWLVLLLAAVFATRPRDVDPAPATMDLGEEPPAVVDLLTNDWRVTPDAMPATLLELAARGFVDLDQLGPGRTVCRVRRAAADGLESYERMVLDHVAGLAVDGMVPAEALTTGPQDTSTRWWKTFQREVIVGDQAWLRGDTIAVVQGNVMVSIRLQGRGVRDRPAALKRLAATAVERLAAATETPA